MDDEDDNEEEAISVSIYRVINLCCYKLRVYYWKHVLVLLLLLLLLAFYQKPLLDWSFHVVDGFTSNLNDSVHLYKPDCQSLYHKGPHPLTHGRHAPYILGNETRYIGEDARFTCSRVFLAPNTWKPHINQILWFKDGILVKPDIRREIKWRIQPLNNKTINVRQRFYKLVTTVKISMIQEEDFGIYNCHISALYFYVPERDNVTEPPRTQAVQTEQRTCHCDRSPMVTEPELTGEDIRHMFFQYYAFEWNSEFRLLKEHPRTDAVFLAPGALLSFATYYRHLGDPEDITMYYTLNDQEPIDNNSTCSIFVLMYYVWEKLKRGIVPRFPFDRSFQQGNISTENTTWQSKASLYSQCIGPESYGIHDIVILRKILHSDGTQGIVEFSHPLKLDIKPKLIDLFKLSDNQTSLPPLMINMDCWSSDAVSTSHDCNVHYTTIDYLSELVFSKDRIYFVCFALIVSFVSWYVGSNLKYMYTAFLTLTRRYLPIDYFAGIPEVRHCPPIYHVTIINGEENDDYVLNDLAPVLEASGLKVFVACRDVMPGRLPLSDLGEAINRSVAFIMIASHSFITHCRCHTFITNMVLQKTSDANLLVIQKDECHVADVFHNFYSVIDFRNDALELQVKTLQDWLHTNFHLQPPTLKQTFRRIVLKLLKHVFIVFIVVYVTSVL